MRRIAKPFFPWVGGKLFLLPYIFQLLPRRAPRLLEVCGGSGAVTLGLGAGYAPLRVYNDIDTDLANLFRCARDRPLALLRELDFLPLHARADFEVVFRFLNHEYDPMDYLEEELQIAEDYFPPMDRQEVKKLLVGRANLPDVQRAAAYYLSIRYSYSATGNSFGGRSVELRRFLGLLRRASDTLQGVVVENKDCCDVVRQYARPGAVIYADPPYKALEEELKSPTLTLTAKKWIEATRAIGLRSKQGKNGGTYAHPEIACVFRAWLHPEYQYTLVQSFLHDRKRKAGRDEQA